LKGKQIEYFRQKLQIEKQILRAQMASLEKSGLASTLGESIGELSVCDNHPADIGDELFERSKDLALRDNAHVLLENVEYSLKKMAAGTYGYCDKCNQQIPYERLEAIPWAHECIDCQKQDDAFDDTGRPLEERTLQPPFQRTFLDNDPALSVGFDGEDALQAVLSYGSSDTPQDVSGAHDYKDLFLNSHEHQGIVDAADVIPNHSNRHIVK